MVGSILVTTVVSQTQTFGLALIAIIVISIVGLVAAILIPRDEEVGSKKKAGDVKVAV